MTGTITYILSIAGYRAMNGPLADERRRIAGAEPPAAYVSYDPRLLAGAGWYGYRIALKGGDRQMVERARYMLSERYVIRDGYEYYADGVYVFGVLLRERVPHYGIGGGAPTPEPEALNFYMPNGGTISLNKTGSPTVVELEYSIDRGTTWSVWQPDNNGNRSLTLTAGQKVYIRNTSEIAVRLSSSFANYYQFRFDNTTDASGSIMYLLCKTPTFIISWGYCFIYLFHNNSNLRTPPLLPATTLSMYCYAYMFQNCINLLYCPELPSTSLNISCYNQMFSGCSSLTETAILPAFELPIEAYIRMYSGCSNLNVVKTYMTNISNDNCLNNWLNGVAATGDFYCPAELTIPTGSSGIPSGWTRHDI